MTGRDRHAEVARIVGRAPGSFFVPRRLRHADDPDVRGAPPDRASRPKPMWWVRWLVAGITVGAVLAAVASLLSTANDDQALGRMLLAALGGAVVGWLVIVVLARLGAFRRTDEL